MNDNILIKIQNLNFKYKNESILNISDLEIEENSWISIVGPSGSGKTTLLNLIAQIDNFQNSSIKIKNDLKTNDIGYILQNHILYEQISVYQNIFLSAKNSPKWKKGKYLILYEEFINKYLQKDKKFLNLVEQFKKNISEKKEKFLILKINLYIFKKFKFSKVFFKFLNSQKLKKIFNQEILQIAKKLEIDHLLNKKAMFISGGQKQRVALCKAIIKKNSLILLDEPFSALDVEIKNKTIELIQK
ncbi:ATP-binding cassette domain-containing protein, partial [[Mycoplasma] collis]|uniref:ATP-binding cassette domain-containing protein n=1 Tax=[Mycoplasma] collis TaxID=2127 RepID=UPI00051AAF8E